MSASLRDAADDAERRVFDDGEPEVAAEDFAAQKFNAVCLLAERFEFLELVGEAADLGFVHLHRAEFATIVR